jgi:hypothetical protein
MFPGRPGQFLRPFTTNFRVASGVNGELRGDSFAPQGQMILAELAMLIKSNAPASPLPGLE